MKLKNIILLFHLIFFISSNTPSLDFQQFIKIGLYKITYIHDGEVLVKAKELYPNSTSSFWEENKDLIDENGNIFLGFGGFLIEFEGKKILIDLGAGPETTYVKGLGDVFGGQFMRNLKKAGVKPKEITDVFLTHLHRDNIGWATKRKGHKYELTFPRANYWCHETEWKYFVKENKIDREKEKFAPLTKVIRFLRERQEIIPGLFPIESNGHSLGLFIFKLQIEKKILWFTSDIFHSVAEFNDPTMSTILDYSSFAQKLKFILLPEFTRSNAFIASARFGRYVFGKLTDENRELIWEPCLTKACKFYSDGNTMAFEDEDL